MSPPPHPPIPHGACLRAKRGGQPLRRTLVTWEHQAGYTQRGAVQAQLPPILILTVGMATWPSTSRRATALCGCR